MGLTPEQINNVMASGQKDEALRQSGVANIVNSIFKGGELEDTKARTEILGQQADTSRISAETEKTKLALTGLRNYYQNLASDASARKNDVEVRELNRKMELVDRVLESGAGVGDLNAGVLSALGLTPPTDKTHLLQSTYPGHEGLTVIPESELLSGAQPGLKKPTETRVVSDLPERKETRIASGDIADDEVKIVKNKTDEGIKPLISRVNSSRRESTTAWFFDSGGTFFDGRSKGAREVKLGLYKGNQVTVGDILDTMETEGMTMEEVLARLEML